MTWLQTLIFLGYLFAFLAATMALLWWKRRRRGTRLPFPPESRLVRMPGETLMEKNRQFWEEDALTGLSAVAALPLLLGTLPLFATAKLGDNARLAAGFAGLALFVASFALGVRWYVRKVVAANDRSLGYFGERMVAEHLEPLKREGWFVFHDVPAEQNGAKFNLDHVAVGPQGIFAIETKTRRKGKAWPGFEDHRVAFDGRKLIWPWGEDTHGLEQVERNALWLTEALRQDTGDRFHVTPILTLPGWWVDTKPARDSRLARVTNPKGLSKFLPSGPAILTEKQIGIVAAKLEARCRNVAF
jgi:hypothetical protein